MSLASSHATLGQIVHAFAMAMQFELVESGGLREQLGGGSQFLRQVGNALAEGEMLRKLDKANQVAAAPTAVAIEQVLARVDVEAGASVLMQGTESDELGASCGAVPAPVVPLQVLQQRNALFELFQILAHGVHILPASSYKSLAPIPRRGWWVSEEKSLLSETQRPGQKTRRKGYRVGQDRRKEPQTGGSPDQPLRHGLESAAQKGKGGSRGIQAAEPAAQGGRFRHAIGIFQRWGGVFPRTCSRKRRRSA